MRAKGTRTSTIAFGLALWATTFAPGHRAYPQGAGAMLYKTKCAACHGADGKGETPMGKANKLRDLASEDVQKKSDADLTATITAGKNKMPAYGKSLSIDQIQGLVGYVRSLAKK